MTRWVDAEGNVGKPEFAEGVGVKREKEAFGEPPTRCVLSILCKGLPFEEKRRVNTSEQEKLTNTLF